MPFIVLMSLYTGVNTGSLVESRGDFWVASALGHRRFYWKVWKERAKRWQSGSIACDEDVAHPARLVQFLMQWTEYLRPPAGSRLGRRAAVFIRTTESEKAASSFQSKWGSLLSGSWEYSYNQFLKEHGLGPLDTRRFRVTGLEIVHQLAGGDLRAMQAWANHKRVSTTERNYVGDGAKQRDEERLAEIMQVRGRWRRTEGKIEARGRPEQTDIGAATPGWTCLNPYSGLPAQRIRCARPTPSAPFARWVASTSNRRMPVHRHITYWRR